METFLGVVLSIILFCLGLFFNFKFTNKFFDPFQSVESIDVLSAILGFFMSLSAGALFTYVVII